MIRTLMFRSVAVCVAVLTAAQPGLALDQLTIGGQTGSQIFFNTTLPRTFNMGITSTAGSSIVIDQVLATLAKGQQTTAPVLIQLYNGLGGTGTLIASGSSAASNFNNQFNAVPIVLSSTVTLTAGYYSIRMTTTDANNYLFKAQAMQLTSTASTPVVLSSSLWVEDSNTSGTAGTTLVSSGTVLATWSLGTNAYAFGNYRVGTSLSATTALVNTALVTSNTMTQALAATGTIAGGVNSLTGLPSPYLSVGGTTNVVTGLNGATTGVNSGTATLSFTSVSGTTNTTGTTAVGSGTIALTGTGYDWANAKVSSGTLAFGNVRTGSTATAQTVAVGNQTVVNATYQDLLNVSGSTNNAAVATTGFSNLAASTNGATTGTVSLAANTTVAGSLASTVSLTYTSNANGVAGLSNGSATVVGGTAPSITTTGGVYDYANATYSGTAFAFGIIHQGGAAASGTVAIGNQTVTNASYQDSLNASASTGNSLVSANGFTGLAASAGGATRNNLVVSIGTGTAGSLNSTVALSLVSNANGVAGLSNGTATVVGSPGAVTTTGTVYSGQSVWNTNGGGQWGTLSSNFGTNWQSFDGSPGLDGGFTNTDTATFGGVVTSGTATVTITGATPSVKSVTFSNSAASYVLAGGSGGSLTLLNAGTSAASLAVTSGSHTISSAVSLGSNAAIDAAGGSRLSIEGILSGAKNLTKTGAGTLVLSGSNTYAGTTTVAAGRLLIHGNQLTATGAITVESGATLGGRGVTGGAVTVLAGGTLSPGASVESLAVGATTFSSSSTFFYEVDSSAPLSAGGDLLTVSGNLSIQNGSILQFTDLANVPSAFTVGTKFTLVSYGSNSWDGGNFTYGATQLTDGAIFAAGLNNWQIDYNDTTGGSNFTADQVAGSYVTITAVAVPEPETIAMLASGLLALGVFGFRPRRRERRRSRSAA